MSVCLVVQWAVKTNRWEESVQQSVTVLVQAMRTIQNNGTMGTEVDFDLNILADLE